MQKLILGIGIPGTGKTSVLKPFAERYGYAYICPDDIRGEMLGDATDQSHGDEVWAEVRKRVADAFARGETVVFDGTMSNERARTEMVSFARGHGADVVQGVRLDVPLEVAKERNAKRERVVPDHVLERMDAKLRSEQPALREGFDAIFTLDEFQELQSVEREGGLSRRGRE